MQCAKNLIGTRLVWGKCAGIVVETEAYLVEGDEACHTFKRPSARAFVERNKPGAAYIYFNYGVHWMLNVLVKGGPRDGLILIRAIEPRRGLATHAATARRGGPEAALFRSRQTDPGARASQNVIMRSIFVPIPRIPFAPGPNPEVSSWPIRGSESVESKDFPWRFTYAGVN